MSIPMYFAVAAGERVNKPNDGLFHLGFGFYSDGSLRAPWDTDGVCVFDDAILCQPRPDALEALSALRGSIYFDFERPPCAFHAMLLTAVQSRTVYLPVRYRSMCERAIPVIVSRPCNRWEALCRSGQQLSVPWLLELHPIHKRHGASWSETTQDVFLPQALCNARLEPDTLWYYDDETSLRKKCEAAEHSGCIGIVGLWQEWEE